MKKQILNFGKALNKAEQKVINGGGYPERGCYEEPVSDVNCVSPWIYVPGCGYTCMIEPLSPEV